MVDMEVEFLISLLRCCVMKVKCQEPLLFVGECVVYSKLTPCVSFLFYSLCIVMRYFCCNMHVLIGTIEEELISLGGVAPSFC